MFRREFVEIVSGAGALAMTGCASRRSAPSLRELSVSLPEHLSLSVAYLAEESGYFRDAGFRLKIIRLSATQSIPPLAGGKLDVVFGGAGSALINAIARGAPIRIVAGREIVNPGCGDPFALYAHRGIFPGGDIDPRRLRGRRFAIRSFGITDFVLDTFLEDVGLSPNEIQRVDLPLQESIAALSNRKIDAMFDLEFSHSPLAVSPDIVKVWSFARVRPFHQYSFIIFGESMLRAGLQVGARFLAAYLKAAQEFLEGRTPNFMREFAASHALNVEKTVSACRDTFVKDGSVDLASVQRHIDWHVRKGYATTPVAASQFVDTRFIEEARRLLANGRWRLPGRRTE